MRDTVTASPVELAPGTTDHPQVLTPEALTFLGELTHHFAPRLHELLFRRTDRQARFDVGEMPDFLDETLDIRLSAWTVAPAPDDLRRRWVEITGPVDRKMIINALNSGADGFMADFEDSTSPTWANVMAGQENLIDAVRGTIDHHDPTSGKRYALHDEVAVLHVRPRGLHLRERHLLAGGRPIPAALVDVGLFALHNADELVARGTGVYLYLPKLESHREARLWNQILDFIEDRLGLARGTIRCTVLIETLPAAFEMDEILFELREHVVGLNCGRWDYIFSFIKTIGHRAEALLPDRAEITMTQPCMRAYSLLCIQTCHRRGVHAMGGMAAEIPIKGDARANELALDRVRTDKQREVSDGHDGTWVAHPALVPVVRQIFEANLRNRDHQLDAVRTDLAIDAGDLLALPEGTRTEDGLRTNVRVGIQYLEAWLRGQGCVPLRHLMEDAATCEICRAQTWQWVRFRAHLDDGSLVTPERFRALVDDEMAAIAAEVGDAHFHAGRFVEARELFERDCLAPELEPFLTLRAYERLDR